MPRGKEPERLRVMDVARAIGSRYQRARDLMLQGTFGETESPPLTVSADGVREYVERRKASKPVITKV